MDNKANPLPVLKEHGFWMKRDDWVQEKNHQEEFYSERKLFLKMMEKMMEDLKNFESETYELQEHQIVGSGHEKQARKISKEYIQKYEQIQKKHVNLLPVMIAILTPENAKFEIKIIKPRNSR